jgi:hypothetical protein
VVKFVSTKMTRKDTTLTDFQRQSLHLPEFRKEYLNRTSVSKGNLQRSFEQGAVKYKARNIISGIVVAESLRRLSIYYRYEEL